MQSEFRGLNIRVVPGAKSDAIEYLEDGSLKVRLRARAVDGKANAALIAYLSKLLKVPKRRVIIVSGLHARSKVIQVDGLDGWKEQLLQQARLRKR